MKLGLFGAARSVAGSAASFAASSAERQDHSAQQDAIVQDRVERLSGLTPIERAAYETMPRRGVLAESGR